MRRICWTIPFFAFGAALASDPACVGECAEEYLDGRLECDAVYEDAGLRADIAHERCMLGCDDQPDYRACARDCRIASVRALHTAQVERRQCYREAGSRAAECVRDCSASESRP